METPLGTYPTDPLPKVSISGSSEWGKWLSKAKRLANFFLLLGDAPLATTATSGHMYIPSCAGVPTGIPGTITGRNAMVWDSVNKKLFVYDGGWNAMN